jgi:hypothetical protein
MERANATGLPECVQQLDALDEEGIDRASLEVAKLEAIEGVRDMIENLVRYGNPVHLTHRIEITDEAGNLLHKAF